MLNIELPSHPTSLPEWLAHAERLHPVTIDMGLERVQRVAQRMGLRLPCPVITVAGTNGKGSTCAMLEAVYTQSGYRTGVYTSPHLVHFEERCRVLVNRWPPTTCCQPLPRWKKPARGRAVTKKSA